MIAVVFDTETSGTDPKRHQIIQIAALGVRDWKVVRKFERKLKFDLDRADPEALKKNSYDAGVWAREAIEQRQAAEEFADFLQRGASVQMVSRRTNRPYMVARLMAHNATFDRDFLNAMFDALNAETGHGRLWLPADSYRAMCTLQRALWYCAENDIRPKDFKLETLCNHFKIEIVGAHDALVDVYATLALARRLVLGEVDETAQAKLFA